MLQQLAFDSVALLVYPGLVAVVLFGLVAEIVWTAATERVLIARALNIRRPAPTIVLGAILAALASTQLAGPFNLASDQERNVLIALAAMALMLWTAEQLPEHAQLLVLAQLCWIVAVLAPSVEPQSLRPSDIGAALVGALIPLKVACGLLYLLCLPILIGLVPPREPDRRRSPARFDGGRALRWFPYCGLFSTLYFPPSGDDLAGVLRFLGLTLGAAVTAMIVAQVLRGRNAEAAPALFRLVVGPFTVFVLGLTLVTSLVMR